MALQISAPRIQFDSNLTEVEQLLAEMSTALLSGDTRSLEANSRALREAMVALSTMAASQKAVLFANPALKQRVTDVSLALARQREGLARRAVAVDRALGAILPRDEVSTYSGASAPAYRGNVARIYAARAT
ncbi:MAG: hypothetical protein JWP29_1039 [Rhodoferax sp.]|nr:hypothetical protein [Rhodoferax sp.]